MHAEQYLKEHGINKESVDFFGITYDENYLHIPIHDEEGKELFITSRYLKYGEDSNDKNPKYKNSLGSHAVLFNHHRVKDAETIVICEGQLDAIRLFQAGVPTVSSTSGAGTFPDEFVEFLSNKSLYIAYDNDSAGEKGTRKLLDLFPKACVIKLPTGIKDICEYFVAGYSLADFKGLMDNAKTRLEFIVNYIPEEFKLVSAIELCNRKYPQMPWLIENILYNEGFCFLYGAEGTGKSLMALSMAIAVASGKDWLNVYKVPKAIPVLYLDKENPHSLVQKRLKAMTDEDGCPEELYFLENPDQFALSNSKGEPTEFALNLSTLIQEKNIGLIIIDSMVDVMVGSENSAEDTQMFLNGLRMLYPNIAILPLHHENKPSAGTFRNSGQRVRGSSNINAQAFTMFRLEPVAKSKTCLTVQQTKARDELKLDKFMVEMNVEPNPAGTGTVVSGFTYMGIVNTQPSGVSESLREMVTSVLSDKGNVSRQMLIEYAEANGGKERTLEDVFKDMCEEGFLIKSKKGREVFYRLKGPIVEDFKIEGGMF